MTRPSPGFFTRAVAAVLLAVFVALPAAAMSKKKQEELGKETFDKMKAEIGIYRSPAVEDYVTRVGQKLVAVSDMPDVTFRFTVLDSEDINAFATPGAYIYINRGLLAYLDSEAQLAAVLAHEIAHVTENHANRTEYAANASKVASTVAAIATWITTGSGMAAESVADTGNVLGAAMVMGYGRDHELEADRVGARYMHKAGYDPQEMVRVLTVLKEQEMFMKARARKEGKKAVAYHGIFSTHPANDDRLKEVIAAAERLPDTERHAIDPAEYRHMMDGLKFNDDARSAAVIGNRYYNGKMGFTVAFPEDWKVVKRAATVLSGPNKDSTILQMQVKRADAEKTPAQFAAEVLKLAGPKRQESLDSGEIAGSTALYDNPRGGPDRRIAVLYFGSYAYVFEGRTANAALQPFYDAMFLSAIRSFRPMSDEDRAAVLGIRVRYVRATDDMTFAKLAEVSPLKSYPEETLRLINGYYPRGEPKPGEWIKVLD